MFLKSQLKIFLDRAIVLGLSEVDSKFAEELLVVGGEYAFCFDIIITQLYEYNIQIDADFYKSAVAIANEMKISSAEYDYIKELIK
jgi:hypothetical protein